MSAGIGRDYPEPSEDELDPDYEDDTQRLLSLVRTGDWLDGQQFAPLKWAVNGLIPQGFGLFTGPPKAGKSWAALDVALAVASGGLALGTIPTGQPRPVLYLALEDGDARLQWRSRRLLGDGTPIPANLHTVTRIAARDVLDLIRAWLQKHGHRNPLVLLDTLGKVMPPALPGEGAYQRDYRIGGHLKAIVDAHPGVTLLVVHHVRKMAGDDWMDSTSGTNGLNGSADFTLNVHRPRGEDSGSLRVTGRDVPEGSYAVTCAEGRWTLDGADLAQAAAAAEQRAVTESLGDRSAEIVEFVAGHPDGTTPAEVALALGMDGRTAAVYLGRLHSAGRLRKPKRGLYTPVGNVVSVDFGPSDYNTPTHTTGVRVEGACVTCGEPMSHDDGTHRHATCEQEVDR